ncbi:unnamed protein product, partial [Ectocarpus sp. 4 AP-2014]
AGRGGPDSEALKAPCYRRLLRIEVEGDDGAGTPTVRHDVARVFSAVCVVGDEEGSHDLDIVHRRSELYRPRALSKKVFRSTRHTRTAQHCHFAGVTYWCIP